MPIQATRHLLHAALSGKLDAVEYVHDPVFGFETPRTCPDVPDHVLNPASSWPNRDVYMSRYLQLAARFVENFKKFETHVGDDVLSVLVASEGEKPQAVFMSYEAFLELAATLYTAIETMKAAGIDPDMLAEDEPQAPRLRPVEPIRRAG